MAALAFEEALRLYQLALAAFDRRSSRDDAERRALLADLDRAQGASQGAPKDIEVRKPTTLAEAGQHTTRFSPDDAVSPAAVSGTIEAVFRREADFWTIAYGGTVLRLKDTKGLQYIHHLLRHPGQEFLALDVIDCGLRNADGGMPDSSQSAIRNRQSAIDDAPLLDAQAKAEYRERLRDLRAELDEVTRFNDLGRTAKLQAEMAFISQQLSAAVGLHGRDRKSGGAERARLTVTKRIKAALKAIAALHAPLAHHLRACVKTGYVCVYAPSSAPPVHWEF
jgi:non-specific serine/threonine protein kinase